MANIEPNPYSTPTSWNFNPLANTSNDVIYDSATTEYSSDTQPFSGYDTPTSNVLWKNPTSWQSSLIAGATQVYYGPFNEVPLYAGATTWYANATPDNLAGQYTPENDAYANLYEYDGVDIPLYSDPNTSYAQTGINYVKTSLNVEYDSSTREYDGMNNGKSFVNWKHATVWIPIAGGNQL